MSDFVYTFERVRSDHWIYNPYKYWKDQIRSDKSHGINRFMFYSWFFDTYNMHWRASYQLVQITAKREEDWIRFQLEWG